MFSIFQFNYNELSKNKAKKLVVKIICYLIYLPYFPLFILILILYPIIRIRIGFINAERIGHLVSEINGYNMRKKEYLIKNKKKNKKPNLDLFFRSKKISNKYIYKKLVFNNLIVLSRFLLFPVYKWILLFSLGEFRINMYDDDDLDSIYYNYQYHLTYGKEYKLSSSEKILGEAFLKSIRFPKNCKLVLLISRDSKYLETMFPNENYVFDDFRNVDINTFKETVNFLIDRGFHVIRIGTITKEKLEIDSDKFFDYSFYEEKQELLDFYFFAICEFVISVSTGIDEIAHLFKKPICYVNLAPIGYFRQKWKSLTIPKKIYDTKTGKILPYSNLISNNLLTCVNKEFLEIHSIKFLDNTSEEILSCVREFTDNILYKDFFEYKESELQVNFKRLLNVKNNYTDSQGFISEKFISNNIDIFI